MISFISSILIPLYFPLFSSKFSFYHSCARFFFHFTIEEEIKSDAIKWDLTADKIFIYKFIQSEREWTSTIVRHCELSLVLEFHTGKNWVCRCVDGFMNERERLEHAAEAWKQVARRRVQGQRRFSKIRKSPEMRRELTRISFTFTWHFYPRRDFRMRKSFSTDITFLPHFLDLFFFFLVESVERFTNRHVIAGYKRDSRNICRAIGATSRSVRTREREGGRERDVTSSC